MKVEPEFKLDVRSVDRIICIMGYTASATCLTSSLIDNHPNALTTPDNLLAAFQDFWEKNGDLPFDLLLSAFIDNYAIMFDARKTSERHKGTIWTGELRGYTTLGLNRNEYLYVDSSAFQRYMKELIGAIHPVPRKLFFQSLHVAYNRALGREVSDPVIVFGLHTLYPPRLLEGLIEDFSDVHFVHMVRHPLRALASRFRRALNTGVSVSHFSKFINSVARGGVAPPSTPASRWRAVKMEDLHHTPEQTLRKICNWLHLPWNEVLLESTINGKKWWNEPGHLQVSGFSTAIAAQNFKEYLPPFDRFRLNVLLANKCAAWDYAVPWWNKNLIAELLVLPLLVVPFKMELMAWSSMKASIGQNKEALTMRAWCLARALAGGYGLGRLAVIRAWILMMRANRKEVQLL